MATRKKDPAKKARKTVAPKKGVKKAKAKKQVPARAKASPKPPAKIAKLREQARARLVDTVGQEAYEESAARNFRALTTPPKPRRWARFRSAVTGLFVSLGFAKKHPDTTVRETR